MKHNEITSTVIDAAIDIHRRLGPGLLESVYAVVLSHELTKRGLRVEREKPIQVAWDGVILDVGFRADIVVEDKALLELKSVETVAPVHKKQMLTYLRLANLQLGLLLNFGSELMKDGIHRIANRLDESETN